MHTSIFSRTASGEFLEITYIAPREILLLPPFRPGSGNALADIAATWFRGDFADLHGLWERAGGADCDGGLLYDITIPGGWFAEMRPNPAEIIIIEAGNVGRKPVSRVAWANDLASQALMIDMMLCHETKEPIFQRLVSERIDRYQLLLPAKGRVYGLRKAADAAARRIEAKHVVDA